MFIVGSTGKRIQRVNLTGTNHTTKKNLNYIRLVALVILIMNLYYMKMQCYLWYNADATDVCGVGWWKLQFSLELPKLGLYIIAFLQCCLNIKVVFMLFFFSLPHATRLGQ